MALRSEPPSRLATLCAIWHKDAATVISFNYDTLVEHAVNHHLLFDWAAFKRAAADDMIDRLPALPPGPARLGSGEMPRTARLLKLHGSTAWFASPNDRTGASLARRVVQSGWGFGEVLEPGERRREFAGRSPFIVPPASAKSGFYDNPVLRQLWQDAGDALASTDEIHLVGYSLPATDLTTRGMLAERADKLAEWVIVNPDAGAVVQSLQGLGVDQVETSSFPSVEEYVSELEGRSHNQAIQQILALNSQSDGAPVVLAWGTPRALELKMQERPGGLLLEPIGAVRPLHTLLADIGDSPVLTQGDLSLHLRAGSEEICIKYPSGRERIIGARLVMPTANQIPTDCVVLSVGRWPPK